MKKILKRAVIPCGIYWFFLLVQIFLLSIMTESWMILWLLMFVTARLTLWVSPFVLSAIVWIAGMWHPKCAIKHIVLANVAVLVINCLSYAAFYWLQLQ